ncbi:MarC family protein [Methanogenium sp. MK-MG]|uniref:MarC family protein n=1 Tax=Methanogenium sp. MK-MG TaxID=2599926 RepID=UPI0013EDE53E|nr:MarC family protein [Methanogenium sp. MK-MG]
MDQVSFFVAFFAALFAIANPIGNIPFFIMYTANATSTRIRQAIAILLGPIIFATILLCMFFGSSVLSFFGISLPAFQIAGAIILFTIAMSMISGTHTERVNKATSSDSGKTPWQAAEAFIPTILVPLVIPIYVGAATITVSVLYGQKAIAGGFLIDAVGVVAIICLMIIVCNLASGVIMRVLGPQGLEIVVRVFGIILLGIAVQMFAEGAGDMVANYIHSNLSVNS